MQAETQELKTCVILLGGDVTATPRLLALCAQATIVIAADSGIRHAMPLSVHVDLWMGDFDSTTPALDRLYAHVPRKTFPRAKDKTDGELAIEEAISRGATRFILAGSFGGDRTDHALLHSFQAFALARRGYNVIMTSGIEEAVPVLAGMPQSFELAAGTLFSLVGFGPMEGVTITGARWPLYERAVPMGSSLTLSNIAEGRVLVAVSGGEGLFITGSSV